MMPSDLLHNYTKLHERGIHAASAVLSTDGQLEFTERLVVTDGFPTMSSLTPSAVTPPTIEELAERRS